MKDSFTLVQRALIECLRDAGCIALAEGARQAWARGQQCRLPVAIGDRVLLDQYQRVNVRATWSDSTSGETSMRPATADRISISA